jgi:hypothetical protein
MKLSIEETITAMTRNELPPFSEPTDRKIESRQQGDFIVLNSTTIIFYLLYRHELGNHGLIKGGMLFPVA